MRRAWACLLAVVLALSLTAGTAAAQTTPPQVVAVEAGGNADGPLFLIRFDRAMDASAQHDDFTIIVDGTRVDVGALFTAAANPLFAQFGGAETLILVPSPPYLQHPEDPVVTVAYRRPTSGLILGDANNVKVESFRWRVGTGPIPTEEDVYDALEAYFSGTGTFSGVQGVVRAAEGKTYYQKLSEEVEAGELHERVPAGRTKWGTEGSSGWQQVGTPSLPPGPSDTCGGTTVPGGVMRGPPGQGGLQGDDRNRFFWACSGDGQWVPVRIPQPGVDYTKDDNLVRPHQHGYNNDCRYKDEEGNPTPVFKADFHPPDHPDPQLRGKPVRDANGNVQGTTIHGGNWDPIAQRCTGRGRRG